MGCSCVGADPAPIVVITGPTATGKTGLSIALAKTLDAEVVSMDSGLVYRGLDIGTAKPTLTERAGVAHHLIDIRDPWKPYSAAAFVDDALQAVADIRARGKRVLIVGGTLLYLRALEHGLANLPPADPVVRAALVDEGLRRGWPALHAELARVDPVAAARIHPNDPQRLQRALEVYRLTGRALGDWQRETTSRLGEPLQKLALVPESRAWLHARIARRLDVMADAGLLAEVDALMRDERVHEALPAMRSVGYRQAWEHLAGTTIDTTAEQDWRARARAATRRLAKRQLTWLRGMAGMHRLPCDTLSVDRQHAAAIDVLSTISHASP